MDLTTYRSLLRDSRARRLLAGLAASSLGDGMSIVTIAGSVGGGGTLLASGLATVLLAAVSLLVWRREAASGRHESFVPEHAQTEKLVIEARPDRRTA